jgi:ABC-type oligopeptide transport system ATPase subunit
MEALLTIKEFVKEFPIIGSKDVVHAVNKINFSVSKGEVIGLVGESGSGKTTVGRCILRLIEPTSGSIVFDGVEVNLISQKDFRPMRSQMQMVFQDPYESLNPRMSIGESIEEPLILFTNLNSSERQDKIDRVLTLVKIQPSLKNVYPHQISGGLQQRVGIARAIILNPKLVVLDEPTSALDISVRSDIVDLLFNLKEELDLSYIFISHDLTAVKYISDRILVMYLGQIVEE